MPYPNALLQATPRNALLGSVADFLAQSYSPERTQQAQGIANFLSLPQVSRTLDRLSYGEPLTTGAGGIGGTTRFNNDALDAAMALAPTIGPAAKLAGKGALATGRFVAPKVGEMAESYLTKAGGILPAVEKGKSILTPTKTYKTSDGFTFYELPNGKVVDNLDPKSVDMSWSNAKKMKEDFGTDVYEVSDEMGIRRANVESYGSAKPLENLSNFMNQAEPDQLYQQALNKQNAKTGNVAQFTGAASKFNNSALMGEFDPRFDPRKLEQAKLRSMTTNVVPTQQAQAPTLSLADFEGRPFITSMSDRTAAGGNLVGINDVAFNRPVELMGGQNFMFNNPGQVWASAQNPVKAIMKGANEIKAATGQNPLFLPWRMAPSGGDFAAMTGETMLSYADSAMNQAQKNLLDQSIKQYIPDWSGVSNPESVAQFRSAPDKVRKAMKKMMDVNFRDEGGLSIGQGRLAVADPSQLVGRDAGVMNVGEIYAGQPMVMQSGHPSYPRGVPGQGLGTLAEDRNIFELMPEVARARGIVDPTRPGQTDIRALQMKPYAGVITNELLKRLGY